MANKEQYANVTNIEIQNNFWTSILKVIYSILKKKDVTTGDVCNWHFRNWAHFPQGHQGQWRPLPNPVTLLRCVSHMRHCLFLNTKNTHTQTACSTSWTRELKIDCMSEPRNPSHLVCAVFKFSRHHYCECDTLTSWFSKTLHSISINKCGVWVL